MGLIRTKHPIALYRNVEILQQVEMNELRVHSVTYVSTIHVHGV